VRVLFTVGLTVAVLAVALPAVDAAGVERADTRTGAAVDRLVEAGRALAAGNDALRPDRGPARRVLELDLPVGGVASAPLRSLTVGPPESTGERGVDAAGAETARERETAARRSNAAPASGKPTPGGVTRRRESPGGSRAGPSASGRSPGSACGRPRASGLNSVEGVDSAWSSGSSNATVGAS